ncbi:Orotidine 5'-phosphate decarboxylase domain-containing protein [Peziza echinospora]|nr:Orotidine 5'-phosphate decarboxylase domain-containing protein [Peziza echinospora]
MPSITKKSYADRAQSHPTAVGRKLFSIMAEKKTNLCLSIDLTDPEEALDVIDQLGPKICLIKTHIDIITFPTTFGASSSGSAITIPQFTSRLTALSRKHNFLIFEDRKFADIGNTVKHQYGGGVYSIVEWAHITNAHAIPGEGIVHGLAEVSAEFTARKQASSGGLDPNGWDTRGLLILEEMSSKGNLFNSQGYRSEVVAMARRNDGFVSGFISMGKIEQGDVEKEERDFITMTPGVNVGSTGDGLGQQYKTPEYVVGERGSDVIIVGRGIYGKDDPLAAAEEYRSRGWAAYEQRLL